MSLVSVASTLWSTTDSGPLRVSNWSPKRSLMTHYVVVAGAQNPWTRRRRIELAELINEPWTLPPPDSAIGSMAMKAFRASGFDYPRATAFTISNEVRTNLLATSRLLTIAPASILRFPTTPGHQGLTR